MVAMPTASFVSPILDLDRPTTDKNADNEISNGYKLLQVLGHETA